MKSILMILLLISVSSCATKYMIPGNRFMTPETQGGAFRGQLEISQSSATRASVNFENGSVEDGVIYTDVSRTGFLFANSIFNNIDFIWSHTGGSNSLLGAKLQFLGSSKTEAGDGHKLGFAALFGGNEHETEDESIEFELTGKEFLILYGYRISPNILPYTSFSYSEYQFVGTLKPSGLRPEFGTKTKALNTGVELSHESFFAKFEASYQQLQTSDTRDKESFMYGYSIGLTW